MPKIQVSAQCRAVLLPLPAVLYDQPDFCNVKTLVEAHCQAQGFDVIFLLKFHCELNLIEQCWCIAERTYCEYPPSSSKANLEHNMLSALDSVKVEQVCRLTTYNYVYLECMLMFEAFIGNAMGSTHLCRF